MNIVLAADDNFVMHCGVTMMSVMSNNRDVHFYLLTEGLSAENEQKLRALVKENGGLLDIIAVPESVVAKLPMPKDAMLSHISVATYYRLFISSLLPANIDKVIYLDCDMIIREDISELFNIDLGHFVIGAVYQDDKTIMDYHTFERLGYLPQYGYFNAGLLLISLKNWRGINAEALFMDFIRNNFEKIIMHDQDVLNATLYGKVKMLDCKWNMLTPFFMRGVCDYSNSKCSNYVMDILTKYLHNPAIVHFASKPKAWEWACSHPFKRDYYKYLDMTVWQGWRPSLILNRYNIIERLRGNWVMKLIVPKRFKGLFM